MKIGNAITYRQSGETREDIDKFRNRTNKLIGSYRGFILELRQKCLVPALRKEQARKGRACEDASPFNLELITTPTRGTDLSADMEIEPIRTRSSIRKEFVSFSNSNPSIRLKGTTPPNSKSGTVEGQNRRQLCATPFFTFLCRSNGKKARGKQCGLCNRTTTFYCMGCHQYFCNLPPSQRKEDITEDLKTDTQIIEVGLGAKQKWIATGEKTLGGKVARRKLDTDVAVAMKATCMNLAHKHKLMMKGDDER